MIRFSGVVGGTSSSRRNDTPSRSLALRFKNRLRHLFYEQRNAVGALHDLFQHIRRGALPSHQMRNHCCHVTLPKAIERQARHMRLPHPRRVELGAESHDEQCRESLDKIHGQAKHLEARRIDPVHILENHQQWLLARQSRKSCRQGLQRSLPALQRGKIERRKTSVVRKREEFAEKCGILDGRRGL